MPLDSQTGTDTDTQTKDEGYCRNCSIISSGGIL